MTTFTFANTDTPVTWNWRGPDAEGAARRYRARFNIEPPQPVEARDRQGVTLRFAVEPLPVQTALFEEAA